MDKSEINTGRRNKEDVELKGLQDRGIVKLQCADCSADLLVLQMTSIEGQDSGGVLTRVVVNCQLCGGHSYVRQIVGRFHPGAPSDDMAFDVMEPEEDTPDADVFFKAWKK